MPMIEVQKGVPVGAAARPSAGRPAKYPFQNLDVGDSFRIEDRDLRSAKGSSVHFSEKTGFTFLIAKDESGSWRAWRTA